MTNALSPDHPRYQGLRAFSELILHSLTINKRSKDDPAHVARLDNMRDSNNPEPVCDKLIEYLYNQQISDQDFNASTSCTSSNWYTAPLAVTTNFERHSALIVLAQSFGKTHGVPVVCWKYRLCEVHTQTQNFSAHLHFALNDPTLKEQLFAKCNGTIGVFVQGGPAALDENTSRHLGLANGSNVVLHSLVFDDNSVSSDKQNEIKHLINNTRAGDIVFIDVIPLYIAVLLKPTNARLQKDWPVHLTLNPPEIVLPIGLRSKYTDMDVFLDFDATKKEKIKVKLLKHRVTLNFAATVHKFQGRTEDYMLIELNERKFHPPITFNMLLVLLSRVRTGNNLKILPLLNGKQSLDYLRKLKPDPDISIWLKGFDENGVWNHNRARYFSQSVQQKRPSKKSARIPQPCSSSTVPTPSIFTSVQPSQSSNLENSSSIPIPPSTHPWMLNLLQQTDSSNFLRTHVDRVALSDDDAYAVLHHPFSTTLASFDIASLRPHRWVSGYAIQAFLDSLYIHHTPAINRFSGTVMPPSFYSQLIADASTDPLRRNIYNFQNVSGYLDRYDNSLFANDIIVPIHLRSSSHWILAIIVPDTCKLMLIDSYPNQDHYETTQILLQWLQDSHFARNMPFDSVSWTIVSSNALPANRPVQYDSTSCGVFVALTAAYWMWYRRLPTSEDFTEQTIPNLRSFMVYILYLMDTQQAQLAHFVDSDLPSQQTFYV